MLSGGLLLSGIWLVAILRSDSPLKDTTPLFFMQVILSFGGMWVLVNGFPMGVTSSPLDFRHVFALHVLLYYGISNIVPALLPELRPELMKLLSPIPLSDPFGYFVGSFSASLLLMGIVIGNSLACRVIRKTAPPVSRGEGNRLSSLPGFEISWIASVSLTGLVVLGTFLYAFQWGNGMPDSDQALASLPLWEQLFFHGLIPFLTVAPLLGANAYLLAKTASGGKKAFRLMIVSGVIILLALAAWGMRLTAIIALLMPVGFLVMNGAIRFRRAILPGLCIIVASYCLVTAVRLSSLASELSQSGSGDVGFSEMLSAIGTREGDGTILGGAIGDASYRAAGLEAVAAILTAQRQGVGYKWGQVTGAGFLQGLPAAIRTQEDVPERVKTAPSHFGIFLARDWVTTILAESVLDFGPILLLFPTILIGFGLTMVDRLFLRFVQAPAMEGLLILRIPFLIYPLHTAAGLADMTLVLMKATVGYALFFLLIGFIVNSRFRRAGGINESHLVQEAYQMSRRLDP